MGTWGVLTDAGLAELRHAQTQARSPTLPGVRAAGQGDQGPSWRGRRDTRGTSETLRRNEKAHGTSQNPPGPGQVWLRSRGAACGTARGAARGAADATAPLLGSGSEITGLAEPAEKRDQRCPASVDLMSISAGGRCVALGRGPLRKLSTQRVSC